jgi:hypothetical protein
MSNKITNNEDKMEEKKKFVDGLNMYFKLKSAYENNIKKQKNKIAELPGLSWREKQNEYAKIKHKCINCKRPVESIFSTKVNNSERQYIALCGDRKNPCPLNIKINLGVILNITDDIHDDEKKIKEFNREIILDKNDLLFGYISTQNAVEKFDKLKEEVADATKIYEFTLQEYLKIADNDEKKESLKKLQLEFYSNLDNFNSMIQQYKNTQNTTFITDAVELYVTTMQPRINEILKKKYSYNGVEYNETDNTYHLIQIPVTIDDLEWDISEHGQKIISMKMGIEKISKKKTVRNTQAITAAIPDINEKKLSEPMHESVSAFMSKTETESNSEPESEAESESESEAESDSDSEPASDDDEHKPLPKLTIYPKLLPDGSIAASEAHRLNMKIELVKGELIAKNLQTNQIYKVTAAA